MKNCTAVGFIRVSGRTRGATWGLERWTECSPTPEKKLKGEKVLLMTTNLWVGWGPLLLMSLCLKLLEFVRICLK